MAQQYNSNTTALAPYKTIIIRKVEAMNLLAKLFGSTHQRGTSVTELTASEYQHQFIESKIPHLLLDVRTAEEFGAGHLTGARNLPLQTIQQKLGQQMGQQMAEVPTDKPVILYCRSGNRSSMAAQLLQAAGYTNLYNAGSLHDLAKQGLPIQHVHRQ